jgi:ribosomal protein S18 acetylase RimI-like enzyme
VAVDARSPEPVTIRAFVPGDEPRLADLWNRAYGGYAGHVPRTVAYWRWCVLGRPGLVADDVLVATVAGDAAAGYGVLGPTGSVIELALDPTAPAPRRAAVAARLTRALEERCRGRGGESISFALPEADDAVQQELRRSGYRSERVRTFTGTLVDVAAYVEAVVRHRAGRIPAGWTRTFRLTVERGAARVYPRLVTRVRIGPVIEVEREPADAAAGAVDCAIATDISTLNRVVFRVERFDDALAAQRIRVEPPEREADARTLVDLVTLTAPWYTPDADGR